MAEVVFDHVTRIYPGNDKPSVDDLNLQDFHHIKRFLVKRLIEPAA